MPTAHTHGSLHQDAGTSRTACADRRATHRHAGRFVQRASTAPARPEVGVPLRAGRRVDARPSRWQGGRRCRDDPSRSACPPGLHHHHAGLQCLLRERPEVPRRHVGAGAASPQGDRAQDGQALRRSRQSAAGQRAQRRQVLDAGNDGHRPQPRAQRPDPRGPGGAHRRRALRQGRVPQVHAAVQQDRAGHQWRPLRTRARTPSRPKRGPRATPT